MLLAASAVAVADDLQEELRGFVDSLRSEEQRRTSKVVIPEISLPENHAVEVEYRVGHEVITYGLLRFVEEGETVRVLRIEFLTYLPDVGPPPFERIGLTVEEARVPRATYAAFVRGLLMLGSAKLEPQSEERQQNVGGSLYVKVGEVLNAVVTVPYAPPYEVLRDRIDDDARGTLWFRFITSRVRSWKPAELADPSQLGDLLLKDLKAVSGWRRDLRVLSLGWLGYGPALPMLRELDKENSPVDLAIHQIELVAECDRSATPPEIFQKLLNWDYPGVSQWANQLLKSRYPEAYKGEIKKLYSSEKVADRLRAIEELENLDAEDLSLARAGLKDPAAEVRVKAAEILGETKPLLAVLADKKLRSPEGIDAKCSAIIYLTWEYPPASNPAEVGPGLVGVATDETEDVRVRHLATVALGYLNYREGIPVLRKLLGSRASPEDGIYELRSGAAEALGYLRAREAVAALIAQFEAPPRTYAAQRQQLGAALARIGDPRGLECLRKAAAAAETEEERSEWQNCAAYAAAIQSRDAKALLQGGPGGGCPAYPTTLLADLFDVPELRALLREEWLEGADRRFVEKALALRERR